MALFTYVAIYTPLVASFLRCTEELTMAILSLKLVIGKRIAGTEYKIAVVVVFVVFVVVHVVHWT